MRRDIFTSIRAVLVFTILLGLVYPFAVWGIGQVAFHGRANGQKSTSTASSSARA